MSSHRRAASEAARRAAAKHAEKRPSAVGRYSAAANVANAALARAGARIANRSASSRVRSGAFAKFGSRASDIDACASTNNFSRGARIAVATTSFAFAFLALASCVTGKRANLVPPAELRARFHSRRSFFSFRRSTTSPNSARPQRKSRSSRVVAGAGSASRNARIVASVARASSIAAPSAVGTSRASASARRSPEFDFAFASERQRAPVSSAPSTRRSRVAASTASRASRRREPKPASVSSNHASASAASVNAPQTNKPLTRSARALRSVTSVDATVSPDPFARRAYRSYVSRWVMITTRASWSTPARPHAANTRDRSPASISAYAPPPSYRRVPLTTHSGAATCAGRIVFFSPPAETPAAYAQHSTGTLCVSNSTSRNSRSARHTAVV